MRKLLSRTMTAGSLLFSASLAETANGVESAVQPGPLRILGFECVKPLTRVGRRTDVFAAVANRGHTAVYLRASLTVPAGMRLAVATAAVTQQRLEAGDEADLRWQVEAERPVYGELRLEVAAAELPTVTASTPMRFLKAAPEVTDEAVPVPKAAPTQLLIGAHHCPLWEADKAHAWDNVHKHPERLPALGYYAQENPEVADWETKWALEHGISFFVYCWYRASHGDGVETRYSSAIHDALFKSRYVDRMHFAIMWENQDRPASWGLAGTSGERDLLETLLPFWLENYFRHPSYLKVDNKPVFFIYRPELLSRDLGSVERAAAALERMRDACRAAGFAGLTILGEYRGLNPRHLQLMKRLGLDYTFAYCWPVPNSPAPAAAIRTQMNYLKRTRELGILPMVGTVSQGWSGWRDEGSIWTLPPADFEQLLRQARTFVQALPADSLGSRMLLLDNWNEWGEGHFIAPYREYGFGYLDAVHRVFSSAPPDHLDLLPEDVGLGPYDQPHRTYLEERRAQRRQRTGHVLKTSAPSPDLIGWWAFDEATDAPVALDYSGNRLGGELHDVSRAPGQDGNALVCDGGAVTVPDDPRLSPGSQLTIECWVRTETPDQHDRWMVNRIYGGATDTGYRLGVSHGKPCLGIPWTEWSHHLEADVPLPCGRWVHLAGTHDGQTMRLYVDGQLHGSLPRRGPIKANNRRLCLGNYEIGHQAHFDGLLDEVRLYRRALTPAEIAEHAAAATASGP